MAKAKENTIEALTIPDDALVNKIHEVRGQKVMLDSDLAELYGVETKVLNQAVKRNIARFPRDFMFELTQQEFEALRSQIVTLKTRGAHTKYLPSVFTEQGVAMLSSVLRSPQAIQVNIQIIRVYSHSTNTGKQRRYMERNRRYQNSISQTDQRPPFAAEKYRLDLWVYRSLTGESRTPST